MGSSKTQGQSSPSKKQKVKKKMKKFLSLILAGALLVGSVFALASCGKKEDPLAKPYNNYLAELQKGAKTGNGTLTVATSPDFAPMEFYDVAKTGSDAIVGFDILLANYIAKELGMKLEVKPMGFDAVMTAVDTKQADLGMSGFSWTADRAAAFNISEGYEAGDAASDQIVICKKGTTFADAAAFSGKKVGAQVSSLQELLTKEQLVTAGAELVTNANIDTLIESLKTGKVDAVALENGNATAILAANEDLELSGFKFEVDDMYKFNVVLVNKENNDLLAKVNAAIKKAKDAGLFKDWYDACQLYSGIATADELGFNDDGSKITE